MKYLRLKSHYEQKFQDFGANYKGMDWPNESDLNKRFNILLDAIKGKKISSLLDFGCGVGLLAKYLVEKKSNLLPYYLGSDISSIFIKKAKLLYPQMKFEERDIFKNPYEENSFDFIVMNGVLTEKVSLTNKEMIDFSHSIISNIFNASRVGIAFNLMSSHVEWKREDLFHYPIDSLLAFLIKNCSRDIIIRMDYKLYEYTVYVYK